MFIFTIITSAFPETRHPSALTGYDSAEAFLLRQGARGTVPPGIRIALHAETSGPVRAYHNQAPAGKEETHKRELPCGFPYLFPHPLSMREHKGTPPSKSRPCGSPAPHHILLHVTASPKTLPSAAADPSLQDPGKTGKSRAKSCGNRFPKNKILSDTPLL